MRTELGAPRPDFEGSHELIPALLGATAFLDDLARCVDEPSRDATQPVGGDGLLVDALLGLLALRRSLRLWIATAKGDVGSIEISPPASSSDSDGSYLR